MREEVNLNIALVRFYFNNFSKEFGCIWKGIGKVAATENEDSYSLLEDFYLGREDEGLELFDELNKDKDINVIQVLSDRNTLYYLNRDDVFKKLLKGGMIYMISPEEDKKVVKKKFLEQLSVEIDNIRYALIESVSEEHSQQDNKCLTQKLALFEKAYNCIPSTVNEEPIRVAIEVVNEYKKAFDKLMDALDRSEEFLEVVNNSPAQHISEDIFSSSLDEVQASLTEWTEVVEDELERYL